MIMFISLIRREVLIKTSLLTLSLSSSFSSFATFFSSVLCGMYTQQGATPHTLMSVSYDVVDGNQHHHHQANKQKDKQATGNTRGKYNIHQGELTLFSPPLPSAANHWLRSSQGFPVCPRSSPTLLSPHLPLPSLARPCSFIILFLSPSSHSSAPNLNTPTNPYLILACSSPIPRPSSLQVHKVVHNERYNERFFPSEFIIEK
ncbi:hypothetical protein E2C01_023887 [Portunus trituberculatus]|uniref:Uncharacterized protein n=1 Tax=Portunus trituberculatus TaxID=210409 RepID=A0A5B7E935_PORTR|nr:hypothetical protein [Portunus trituberculatus]